MFACSPTSSAVCRYIASLVIFVRRIPFLHTTFVLRMDPATSQQELLAVSEAMEGQPIQGSPMEQPRCSWRRASLPILLMTLLMGVGIVFSVKKGSADLSCPTCQGCQVCR